MKEFNRIRKKSLGFFFIQFKLPRNILGQERIKIAAISFIFKKSSILCHSETLIYFNFGLLKLAINFDIYFLNSHVLSMKLIFSFQFYAFHIQFYTMQFYVILRSLYKILCFCNEILCFFYKILHFQRNFKHFVWNSLNLSNFFQSFKKAWEIY